MLVYLVRHCTTFLTVLQYNVIMMHFFCSYCKHFPHNSSYKAWAIFLHPRLFWCHLSVYIHVSQPSTSRNELCMLVAHVVNVCSSGHYFFLHRELVREPTLAAQNDEHEKAIKNSLPSRESCHTSALISNFLKTFHQTTHHHPRSVHGGPIEGHTWGKLTWATPPERWRYINLL